MMPLLLNFLRMDVGEAFYMGANEPHAYLKGDLMEVTTINCNYLNISTCCKIFAVESCLNVNTSSLQTHAYLKGDLMEVR
jgi:mannose-6-phosphate isomerase